MYINAQVILFPAFLIPVGVLIFKHHANSFCHPLKELSGASLPEVSLK